MTTKHYKCEKCKQEHRRNALVLMHKELLCRKCIAEDYETLPGKYTKKGKLR